MAPPQGQRVFRLFGDSILDSLHYSANFHFNDSALSHISIDYKAGMTSRHNLLDSLAERVVKLDIASHAVLHLYDHTATGFVAVFDLQSRFKWLPTICSATGR